ncbi:MAG TPA: hypothetical protein ENJ24_04175, partial [Gammaproteobacteria bacterium]|nr:hypothetical protein [Gammaproteobacteria bacterium]
MSEIVIFDQTDQPIEVRLEAETVWLTQAQMAELFEKTKQNISLHIRNIFKEGELEEDSVVKESLTTAADGKRYKTRYYNLDVIISVGYRVKSQQGVRFRQWVTRVLREHLTQGSSLNEHRLAQRGLEELTQAVELLGKTLTRQELVTDLGREVVGLILSYARTWRLLLDYDEDRLELPPGARPARGVLDYDEAYRALDALAEELRSQGEVSELFARERGDGLAALTLLIAESDPRAKDLMVRLADEPARRGKCMNQCSPDGA